MEVVMNQTALHNGTVSEKLETAINLGCTMVSRSKEVRKKIKSSPEDRDSLKKSLKELDKMSIELVDKLFEINARIELHAGEDDQNTLRHNKFRQILDRLLRSSRKRIEKMKLAYQDMLTL